MLSCQGKLNHNIDPGGLRELEVNGGECCLTGSFWNEDACMKLFKYYWFSRISRISPCAVFSCLYLVSAAASDITSQILDPRLDLSCNLQHLHCHFYHGSLVLARKRVREIIFPTHWQIGSVVSLIGETACKCMIVASLQVMRDRPLLPPVGTQT